jgi:hypothetical protein
MLWLESQILDLAEIARLLVLNVKKFKILALVNSALKTFFATDGRTK